jgi:protein-tyrosine phosphatase
VRVPDQALRVLFVCTGNLCRSPMAERLLHAALAPAGDVVMVTSAGTSTYAGRPMDPNAERALRELGVPLDRPFRSRTLSRDLVVSADLVLTAERPHRAVVAELDRGSWGRTFTLLEFKRLVEGAQVGESHAEERGRALVAWSASRRTLLHAARPEDDDIEDPIGQRYAVFRRSGECIAESVRIIAAQILGTPVASSAPAWRAMPPWRRWLR